MRYLLLILAVVTADVPCTHAAQTLLTATWHQTRVTSVRGMQRVCCRQSRESRRGDKIEQLLRGVMTFY